MYEFVRDNSWGVSSEDMAQMVNEKFGTDFSATAIKQFRQRNKIKSGLTGWFRKGRAPGNKGKKQSEFMGPEAIERTCATRFKKGRKPVNEMPVGSIVENAYGYLLRKRSMEGTQWERWEFLHRAVWEEHNGPLPDGMMVTFKDGNKLNCGIDNLMLVTRGENAVMNKLNYRFEDPELTVAGLNVIRLKNKAKEKRRKSRN